MLSTLRCTRALRLPGGHAAARQPVHVRIDELTLPKRWLEWGVVVRIALLSVTAVLSSACRYTMPVARPNSAVGRECPPSAGEDRPRLSVSEVDSSLTHSRVRWAIADLLGSLNSREAADLSLRYDWTGDPRQLTEFLRLVRTQVATTRLVLDSSGAWWSDAPGRKQQMICLMLSVQGSNGGGVPLVHRIALRAKLLDDGRAAWLSRLSVTELSP